MTYRELQFFPYFFIPYKLTNGTCTLLPLSYSRIEGGTVFVFQSWNTVRHVLALIYALIGSQALITCPLLSHTTFSVFLHLHIWVHGAVWPRKNSAQGWQLISHMKGRAGAVSAYTYRGTR